MPPAERQLSVPPPPLKRATPSSVVWSRGVVLASAVLGGFKILFLPAPPVVVGAALLLVVTAAVALFRVDWESYWFTMPYRAKGVARAFTSLSAIGILILAGSVVGLWYGSVLWKTHYELPAVLLFLFCGFGVFYVAAGSLGVFVAMFWVLLVNREGKISGRHMVEGQDVHGAADFASAASIDSALKGSGATASTPRKFDD